MSGEGIRVLLVDDDPDLCEVAGIHLTRIDDDISAVTASSAEDALERLASEHVDCIVSDHDMPGMDGLEFLRAVRETDPELPFILFTGKGSEEIAAKAVSAGVTEYLQKRTGTDQYALLANRIQRAVGERRAKTALEESERKLSTLIANLSGMVYRCRVEEGWPMTFVSEGAADLTGYDPRAIESGAVIWGEDVIHEDDREAIWEPVETAIEAGEPFQVTYRIVTAGDEVRWVWEQGRCVEREEDVDVLEGFITDITARKTREQELRAEREFTQNVIDALEDAFFVVNPDGHIVRWNDRVTEVTGYDDSELAGVHARQVVPAEYESRLANAREETLERGAATFEAEIETHEGERIPYEFRTTRFEGTDGEVAGICGIARDVSERVTRERELERYETIVEAVGDPVYALDEDGVFTFANEAFEPLSGYAPEELLGKHVGTVTDDEVVQRVEAIIAEMLRASERSYRTFEFDLVTAEDERVPCEAHIGLLPREDGAFRGIAGIVREIADRKERERRLEEFASVVSHDLRNPLNVIRGRVEIARRQGDTDHLEAVADAAERMERLVDELLTLARQGEGVGEREPVDLSAVATDAWSAIEGDDAALTITDSETVEADPDRLRELLSNLFGNAREHANDGGPVTVRVGTTPEGFYVEDDGSGIPSDRCDAVFERGYTTSPDGTGFGLAIVADVVEAHGWEIAVTESAEGGARFEISTETR